MVDSVLGGLAQAVEVGPRSNKSGPQLTLFQGVTVLPHDFLGWFEQSPLVLHCTRFYWIDKASTAIDQVMFAGLAHIDATLKASPSEIVSSYCLFLQLLRQCC